MIRLCFAAVAASFVFASIATAQPGPADMRPKAAKNYICPTTLQVRITPAQALFGGWQANTGAFTVALDPANPPNLSGGNMVCWYKLGSQPGAFNILQPVGTQKCSVLSNHTGFVCTY